jgi:hypothetical protein
MSENLEKTVETMIQEIKEKLSYYTYGSKEGVLIYTNEVEDVEPMETNNDVGFYDFQDLPENALIQIINKEIEVNYTYTASYAGDKGDGEGIDIYEMVNIENGQKFVKVWEEELVADTNEYERELLTKTDQYYDWTSERTKIENDIYDILKENDFKIKKSQIKSLEKEWKETCAKYTDSLGACDSPPSVEDMINEIVRNF